MYYISREANTVTDLLEVCAYGRKTKDPTIYSG